MIYLASPYSHSNPIREKRRFKYVCLAAARLISEGHQIYSPIAMSHPIHEYSKNHQCKQIARLHKRPPEFWYKFDEAMMQRCGRLIILGTEGWKESKGVIAEYTYFVERELPWTIVSWFQVTDDKPLFLKWHRGHEISKVAEQMGV